MLTWAIHAQESPPEEGHQANVPSRRTQHLTWRCRWIVSDQLFLLFSTVKLKAESLKRQKAALIPIQKPRTNRIERQKAADPTETVQAWLFQCSG